MSYQVQVIPEINAACIDVQNLIISRGKEIEDDNKEIEAVGMIQ